MKEGLRIVATYRCNRNCKFCYQRTKSGPFLDITKLKQQLTYLKQVKKFTPIYITIQGGEVTINPEWLFEICKVCDFEYPQVFRKSVTSNGDADLEIYKELALYGITHLSFSLHGKNSKLEKKILELKSSGFFTVRVNCFAHSSDSNLKYVYDFCKDNQVQLTMCEDLRNEINEDVTNHLIKLFNIKDPIVQKHKFQHIVIDRNNMFRFWIYKHLDHYDYNNYIIIPSGKIITNFDDVIKSEL